MRFGLVAIVSVCLLLACSNAPKIVLSSERVSGGGHVEVKGTGFTPKANVRTYLKRPDGTEFPSLTFITDGTGQFTHNIDTHPLLIGTHEVWAEDSTGVLSNTAKFEVVAGRLK
jgi:hypothetical protein